MAGECTLSPVQDPDFHLDAPDLLEDGLGAWWSPGRSERPCVLLAHGAGAPPTSPFMAAIAEGLAAADLGVLRFRYPYMERMAREGRRRPPDRAPRLEAAHELALAEVVRRAPDRPLVLVGKSMGSRMGTHLAARGGPLIEGHVRGLVHLGFPLHPAGKPSTERAHMFRTLALPALFLSGTRDALCDLDLLRQVLGEHGGPTHLEVLEKGDHDFAVPKRTGRTREDVLAWLVERTLAWIEEVTGR